MSQKNTNTDDLSEEEFSAEDVGFLGGLMSTIGSTVSNGASYLEGKMNEFAVKNPELAKQISRTGSSIVKGGRDLAYKAASQLGLQNAANKALAAAMAVGEIGTNSGKFSENPLVNFAAAIPDAYERESEWESKGESYDVYQQGYLLPPEVYYSLLEKEGYKRVEPTGDNPYGLVSRVVGDRNIPIFQEHEDEISREDITPVTNISWVNEDLADQPENFSIGLKRARSYPSTIYVDPTTGVPYFQGWDYHNYGIDSPSTPQSKNGSTASTQYNVFNRVLSNLVDMVGNPVVRKTGIRRVSPDNFAYMLNSPEKAALLSKAKYSPEYQQILDKYKQDLENHAYATYLATQNLAPEDPNATKQYPRENLKQYIEELKQNGIEVERLPWLQ